ncbi:chromosomal replication initiator protein DnaA [Candidatus Ozemobacteraceae bacterium]|nr:chromosomal replication initiator protein DnaA [Candidatus Ozemobacteraceae bacterium]OQA07149.1 MAG: Chromosomal replication initiator protein DnaA [bacterium ADurb.Bin374]
MEAVSQLWSRITGEIRTQVNEANLNIFLNSINPVGIEGETLVLEALNEVCRDWVERRYHGMIQKILQGANPPLSCIFVTRSRTAAKAAKAPAPIQPCLPAIGGPSVTIALPEKAPAEKPHAQSMLQFNGKYTFDTFIVGKSNQFAHAVCQAVASKPLGTAYNPVFIYGGVGLGKTHLMQAIGQEVLKTNPKLRVAYLSSETFTNEFIDAVKDKKMNEFRAKYRRRDLLLIDDVQFFVGKDAVIEEFFHTFNELFQNKKQIILTSDTPPKKIQRLEERLVSRFEMGVVCDIQNPDLEMRVAILKKAAARSVIKISDDILMYLAEGVVTDIRALEGAFTRVVAYASVVQKAIDKDLVDQVLKEFFREQTPGKVTISWIMKRVSEYYDIPEVEMTSKRRSANLVLPRQVAMRISQMLTDSSLNQIGANFGGRDHTTVMHSCEKIRERVTNDPAFAAEFERLLRWVDPQNR